MERREFLKSVAVGSVGLGLGATGVEGLAASPAILAPTRTINVLVWDEQQEAQRESKAYDNYLGNAVAEFLAKTEGLKVTSANFKEAEQGLSEQRIAAADVFVWWGHQKHNDVNDSKVESIVAKVKSGKAGFVALHSAHYSKPFKRLMGTNCGFRKVDSNKNEGFVEHLRIVNPRHPIAKGVKDFHISKTEIYAEPFEVPMPDAVVIYGHWDTGDSFPDVSCWTVGGKGVSSAAAKAANPGGRVVYFRPGHETFPIFHQPEIQQVVTNCVLWAAPQSS
ncbi:MAG: ThuA domain-containing protein [Planctomycetes bacterium]|nr:ThuA domain-containing protein [Planctomycetota bacterium]